jgi:glycosyltransferase involved in cell wall biosynthesis
MFRSRAKRNPHKLVVAATVPLTTWTMMRGQLAFLRESGYTVVLAASPGPLLDATADRERITARAISMERDVHVRRDLTSAIALVGMYLNERPSISIVSTPKAGLLAGVAALLTRVPTRIYMLRGLRLETATGPRRMILWLMEWLAIRSAHHVIVVSPSLLRRARELRLLTQKDGVVLGRGASNGVELDRFAPSEDRRAEGLRRRQELGIPQTAFVFGFVGRLTSDKGISELATAFARIRELDATVWLLIVGEEEGAGLTPGIREQLSTDGRVRYTGWVDEPAFAYQMIDALVLPTYREGLPNACLEAAAAGRAVITTTATGAIDAIEENVTGLLVAPGDADALFLAMRDLSLDREKAIQMGAAGRTFVERYFGNDEVWGQLLAFLQEASASKVSHAVGRRQRRR